MQKIYKKQICKILNKMKKVKLLIKNKKNDKKNNNTSNLTVAEIFMRALLLVTAIAAIFGSLVHAAIADPDR